MRSRLKYASLTLSGFLTRRDIRTLTGLGDKAEQLAELRRQGIVHRVNAAGNIIVTWGAVDGKPPVLTGWSPDLSRLESRSA